MLSNSINRLRYVLSQTVSLKSGRSFNRPKHSVVSNKKIDWKKAKNIILTYKGSNFVCTGLDFKLEVVLFSMAVFVLATLINIT